MTRGRANEARRDEAAQLAADLESVRRILRDSLWAQARRLDVPLTPPQLRAVEILVDEARTNGAGLSLSQLSERMGLGHSTVSGIVARLADRGLVVRATRQDDKRFVEIALAPEVEQWVERDLPAARLQPLIDALSKAGAAERTAILEGVSTLARLLNERARSGDTD